MVKMEPHVAVLVFPFAAHAASLLSIVHRLSISTPNILFSFFSTEESNKKVFSSAEIPPNIRPFNVLDGVPEGYVFVGKHHEDIELFMNAAPENFKKAVEAAVVETGRKLSCLVTDAFLWFGAELAEEWDVPWLPCWTSGPNSLSSHVYTDLIREKVGIEGIEGRKEELLEFVPGMSKVRIGDLPDGILFGNLQSVFSNMLHQMGRRLPKAAAVFINSFEELDPALTYDLKSTFKKLLNVGPFTRSTPSVSFASVDKYGCLPWLDKQKQASVAYVSFGTVAKASPNEMEAIAEALEVSKMPFIWSLRENLKANLPKGFLERTKSRGMVVDWVPQLDVLAHDAIGVFITHCGWNSMLESIAEGVPMIGRPFFGDHKINGRMMEDVWEIGVMVNGGIFTKNGLLTSLDLILCQEKGKKITDTVKRLKQLCRNAIGPTGSSTQNFKTLVDIVSRPKDA